MQGIELGDGTTADFFLSEVPPEGTTIAPRTSIGFRVGYHASDPRTIDLGSVHVRVAGTPETYLATLRGEGAGSGDRLETFEQAERSVDVLWVIDEGRSAIQALVAYKTNAFLAFARENGIDFQIGVTAMEVSEIGAPSCEDGRLIPVDNSRPRILGATAPNLDAILAANLTSTMRDTFFEQPFEAARRGLTPPVIDRCDDPRHPEPNDGNCGFLRKEADLAIVVVADEDDQSPGTVEFYSSVFQSLKGFQPGRVRFHAIAGPEETGCSGSGIVAEAADRLAAMVESTDSGSFHSVCAADWTIMMRDLSRAVFGYRSCFALEEEPRDRNGNGVVSEGDLEVRIDGVILDSTGGTSGQVRWRYDAGKRAVCFEPGAIPEPGHRVGIAYSASCVAH